MPSLKLKMSASSTQQDVHEEVSVSLPPFGFTGWTFEEVDLLIKLCKENKTLIYDDISQLFNAATTGQQRTGADIRHKLLYKPRNDLRSNHEPHLARPEEEEEDDDQDSASEAEDESQPTVGVGKWSAKDENLVMRLFAEYKDLSYTKVTQLFNAQTTGPQRTMGSVRQKFLYGKKKSGSRKTRATGTKPKQAAKPTKPAPIPRKPKEAGDGEVIGHDASGKPIAAVVVDAKTGRPKKQSVAKDEEDSEADDEDRPSSMALSLSIGKLVVLTESATNKTTARTPITPLIPAASQQPAGRPKKKAPEETQEARTLAGDLIQKNISGWTTYEAGKDKNDTEDEYDAGWESDNTEPRPDDTDEE
ncbi:hypothetical protein H2199_005616 [Coniosporium tulheliwenetii]|uniref:Uncharacterized protein n=1 Tax=Coniosporium tulheliwenetii TaxID=3383036 RepID=A0ACC2Z059_9PEZI|nr:hypothetical protein H2199_005616 [Cladosporium sp. JES 115]